MSEEPKAAFIELHDAHLSRITFEQGTGVRLEFEHLSVFVPTAPERYDVWSCKGTLKASEVTELVVSGKSEPGDYISEGTVRSRDGAEIPLVSLQSQQHIERVALVFGSGVRVKIAASTAEFDLVAFDHKIESWEGPLNR